MSQTWLAVQSGAVGSYFSSMCVLVCVSACVDGRTSYQHCRRQVSCCMRALSSCIHLCVTQTLLFFLTTVLKWNITVKFFWFSQNRRVESQHSCLPLCVSFEGIFMLLLCRSEARTVDVLFNMVVIVNRAEHSQLKVLWCRSYCASY